MKMVISWTVLITLLYTLQTSLLPFLSYNGVSANLMLLLTVSTAFIHGYRQGVLMGLVTGTLQDFTTGSFFGCTILSYMLIGLIFGKFSDRIFKEQIFFPVLSAPIAAIMHFFIMTALLFLLGYRIDLTRSIQTILQPLIVYQILFSWIIHKIVYTFYKFAERHG